MERTRSVPDIQAGAAVPTAYSRYQQKAREMQNLALGAVDIAAREQFLLLAMRYERLAQGIG